MKRALGIVTLVIVTVAVAPKPFGGWAVVTFDDIPEYLVVDEPTTLTFKMRQHGRTLLRDRSPSITLKDPDAGLFSRMLKRRTVDAVRNSADGSYEVIITPTEAGEVTLVVNTDLFRWKTELLPMPVRSSHAGAQLLTHEDRGRQLFAAKGCATCHTKFDDPAFADWQVVRIGPDLTGRTYPDDWLTAKIEDPTQFANASSFDKMPNLNIENTQIAALVRYINHKSVATDLETEES